MAKYGKQLYINFLVWDTENNAPRTGDEENLTMRFVQDGSTPAVPSNAPTEISSDLMPGIYRMLMTDFDMMADTVVVSGTSSTPNTVVYPTFIETHNEVNANIVKVNNSAVTSVDNFKANLTGVAQETTVSAVQTSIDNLNDFDPATQEVDANLVKINGDATNEPLATLTLRKINIVNDQNDQAVNIYSNASNSSAVGITSDHNVGLRISGGQEALRLHGQGDEPVITISGGNDGVNINCGKDGIFVSGVENGVRVIGPSGNGVTVEGGDGDGLKLTGSLNQKDIRAQEIEDIDSKVVVVDGKVVGVQTTSDSIEGKVDTLDGKVDLTAKETTLNTGVGDILTAIGVVDGKVVDVKTVVDSTETKIDGVVVTVDGVDGKVDNVYIDTQSIVNKLPAGNISDFSLSKTVDGGETVQHVFELVQALVNGEYRVNHPATGLVTFFKRDNSTVITTVKITDEKRERL